MAIYANFITGGVNNHTTTSEEANSFATDFVGSGVVGTTTNTSGIAPMTGAFAVNAQGSPNMTVAVSAGQAYVTATPTGQSSQKIRVYSTATENVTIAANSSGSTKYDWVYIKVDATKAAAPNLAGTDVSTIVTSRSTSQTTDDGTPPTYGTLIAVVTVANGATSITNGNITDRRSQSVISATSANESGWTTTRSGATIPAPNTVAYNGNRSYTLTFNSTDLTSYVSPGMRVRTTRTVTAPTQCTSLNGSTQYYSKTSPTGLTFTTTFTCSAWIKLSSYALGGIIARRNADTEGWAFRINADGTVTLVGLRIASNNKSIKSFQSIPLNKWVHVAATLDMSAGDTTAQKIWIDGVEVPRSYNLTGTATALVQGTTALVVGAEKSAGDNPFSGKIAQAAVFSSQLSDATVNSYYSQGLSGSETNLVSAYSFNNSINDLNTTNANNLTAQGSAVATNADSPFSTNSFGTETGTLDFGIVQSCTFSTNTTMVVQVPEGCTIPTSGGVSAFAYSVQKAPYGMPVDASKWLFSYTANMPTYSITTSATAFTSVALPVLPSGVTVDYSINGNFITNHAGGAGARDYSLSIRNGSTSLKTSVNSAPAGEFLKTAPVDTIFTSSGGETINFYANRNTDNGGTIDNRSQINIAQLTSFL